MEYNLTPMEIRLLQKCNKKTVTLESLPGYFFVDESLDIGKCINGFFERGLLTKSDLRYEVGKLTIPQLKELLAEKQATAKGNKEKLVERVFEVFSEKELSELGLPRYLLLTDKSNAVIEKNEALLLAYNGLNMSLVTAEDIVEAQNKGTQNEALAILLDVYAKKLGEAKTDSTRYLLTIEIQKIYRWAHNEAMVENLEQILCEFRLKFDREYEQRRAESERRTYIYGGGKISTENSLSDEEFDAMVKERLNLLGDKEKEWALERIRTENEKHDPESPLSAQEEILIELDSMVRGHLFHEKIDAERRKIQNEIE